MLDKKLYLVDGHALVYRAYYAFIKNPLTNSKGQPTSAVFGFANYLIRLIETYNCPYLAVVMDSSKPTFRHEMYSQYKANRPEMPDDLRSQMPIIYKLMEAMNITVIKEDGLEADDLIGVVTHKAVEADFEVYLVTRDKDLMQLVGPKVKMLAPEGTGTLQLIGTDEVKEKMGVYPQQIVDYLALIGDASDNIPGVPGIGPKTALKIITAAGSVDRVLEDPSLAGNNKLAQKIEEHRELLCISKMLATLKTDNGIALEPHHLLKQEVDRDKCIALFRELDLHSLLKNPLFGGAPRISPEVKLVTDINMLLQVVKQIKDVSWVSIDTQTTGLLPRAARLAGISLSIDKTCGWYIPVGHTDYNNLSIDEVLAALKDIIESPLVLKIGQNLKYDYQVLKNYGLSMRGIEFDTMIAAYLIDSGKRRYDLDLLAQEWLKLEITPISKLIGTGKNERSFADVQVNEAAGYAVEIVCLPIFLREILEPLLVEKKCKKLFDTIEMPLIQVLGDLEWQGMLIDTKILAEMSREFTAEMGAISDSIYEIAGGELNLNSPKQIGEVLFEKLGIPGAKKTKNGAHSTSVTVLEKLAPDYPVVQKILEYREVAKLLSTYIDALPGQILQLSGRVHSSFNQTVTATGRLSSTNPNLQNIPIRTDDGRRIREAFIAATGNVLISADYSQIELRILAHLSNDPLLIQAFREDMDIHTQTASAVYGIFPEMVTPEMRRAAKTINFGLMYGMGPINLSRQLKISFGEAKAFIESYFKQFPTIKGYMESTIDKARKSGFTETLLGRRRYLPEIDAKNRNVREAAERTAINTPVQGTAADIIKIAMIRIHENIKEVCGSARMLLQVHDELLFEVAQQDAEALKSWVVDQMSCAYQLNVPIKVEAGVGKNWSCAH